jgi:hypothetical protein
MLRQDEGNLLLSLFRLFSIWQMACSMVNPLEIERPTWVEEATIFVDREESSFRLESILL